MASAQPPVPNTNGSYLQQADPQSFAANTTAAAPPATVVSAPQQPAADAAHNNDEVGWYFVEQYYTTLNGNPDKLHLFYNKKSTFVWGTEGESLALSHGRAEIQDKIAAHEFKDCKVRVSNVDSQASIQNGIVIQVLGEMSNNGAPHRKFAQTFFLAEQPNGYFVLNDIFRYLKDDEDVEEEGEFDYADEETAAEAAAEAAQEVVEAVVEELVDAIEEMDVKETSKIVVETEGDKVKIEETHTVEPVVPTPDEQGLPPPINGSAPAAETEPEPKTEEPAVFTAPDTSTTEIVPPPVEVEDKSAPVETVPTPPVSSIPATKQPERAPVPPPVAIKPKTWASVVAPPRASPPATPITTATPQQEQKPAVPTTPITSATPSTPNTPTTPSGGWQTADTRRHTRPGSVASAVPQTHAYVKNVSESVTVQALRDVLTKFGPLKHFEVSRTKNCAFVEFETPAGFTAASAANPHRIGDAAIYVEERRRNAPPNGSGFNPRGPSAGRGDARPTNSGGRGGNFNRHDGRGGGRGGPGGARTGFLPARPKPGPPAPAS